LAKKRFPSTQIQVYEQNPKNATFGFGIILAEGGYSRFHKADAESADAMMAASFPTQDRTLIHRGEPIQIEGGPVGYAIPRIKLLNTLQALALQAGVEIYFETRVDNPDRLGADLIVGADGVHSVVRSCFEGEFGTSSWTLTGRMAWYGTTQRFKCPILSFKTTKFGHFWAAAYPHQDDMGTFVAECDADAWIRSGLNRMSEPERLRFAEDMFADELDGHPLLTNNSRWASLPVIRTRTWFVGNRVLIGDALHSPHPSIGSGTRIAMEDAVALIDELVTHHRDIPSALSKYQQNRTPQANKLIDAMEKSARWYEGVGEKIDALDPVSFVFDFMTRTGRLNPQRLWDEYPNFMARYGDQWARLADAGAPSR
jgi:2-polyprenyl-6-methoxyphenol hydroxylase-like FAD-dependent oxidoreductase